MKLLLIDDSTTITHALAQALATSYSVDVADTGAKGLEKAELFSYSLILLDLNLPDMSGLEVCKRLRSGGITTPILILTGENKVMSKINLLDAGADDYLTKPFSLGELEARLRVLSRRAPVAQLGPRMLSADDLRLDAARHQVERGGKVIKLRRKEFALLECLLQNAGRVVTRDILTAHAWPENEDPWTNTVDVHIKYLRDKVDRPFAHQLIKTVHGLGYKLETPRAMAK